MEFRRNLHYHKYRFLKIYIKKKDYKRRVILELKKNYINNELEFKKELEELENLKRGKKVYKKRI
jgi:hypothetical protein